MAQNPPFEVLPYSIETLQGVFVRFAETDSDYVANKTHLQFFKGHGDFKGFFEHPDIAAKTIVVEPDYIDHDYLEDFAAYYVRCFKEYPRKCARLHFFNCAFAADQFRALLAGDEGAISAKGLNDAYLGFIVVKPLPRYFIGRTCLRTYQDDGMRRQYKNVRECNATLFGIPLTVKSLAFQEQDQVVAACATSALWSAFHATSNLFHHSFPSPVEITRQATEHAPVRSRVFPHTDGLDVAQMAHAIRDVGLEPLYVQGDEIDGGKDAGGQEDRKITAAMLRSCIYAYSAFGIPVIVLVSLIDPQGGPRYFGDHACTVTGYSLGAKPSASDHTALFAQKIDKLYVHDDQVGPFARMELVESNGAFYLSTSWGLPKYDGVIAKPFALLVPLYNKIRIPFNEAVTSARALNRGIAVLVKAAELTVGELVWDVRLTDNNEFKRSIAEAKHLDGQEKQAARLQELPRYMWRLSARDGDALCVDLLIDATDINQGKFIRYIHVADSKLRGLLAGLQTRSDDDIAKSAWANESEAAGRALLGVVGVLRKLHDSLNP